MVGWGRVCACLPAAQQWGACACMQGAQTEVPQLSTHLACAPCAAVHRQPELLRAAGFSQAECKSLQACIAGPTSASPPRCAGAVYLLGVDDAEGPNAISIARSWDGGASWNRTALLPAPPGCQWATGAARPGRGFVAALGTPQRWRSAVRPGCLHSASPCKPACPALLPTHLTAPPQPACSYRAGSVPVLLHLGILYRGTELWCGPSLRWPQSYQVPAPAG